jgi:hypothetical protein
MAASLHVHNQHYGRKLVTRYGSVLKAPGPLPFVVNAFSFPVFALAVQLESALFNQHVSTLPLIIYLLHLYRVFTLTSATNHVSAVHNAAFTL